MTCNYKKTKLSTNCLASGGFHSSVSECVSPVVDWCVCVCVCVWKDDVHSYTVL